MEQITEMLKSLQTKLDEQANELKEMKESIPNSINKNIDEKFFMLEAKQQQLEKITEEQGKKIQRLESFSRRKNLLFFGVEETENSYFSLQNKILTIIQSNMEVECQKTDIEYVTRMGKKSGKTRPVIVTLTTIGKKIEILRNKKMLNETTSYYIKQDYPPEILEERKKLNAQLQREKAQGKNASIKHNKLVIESGNEKIQQENRQERHKRGLSFSPETEGVKGEKPSTAKNPIKKNKMDQYLIKTKGTTIPSLHLRQKTDSSSSASE